jgi:hypothetical protein
VVIPGINNSLDLTTQATLAFWIKPDTIIDFHDLLGKGTDQGGTSRNYYVGTGGGTLVFGFFNDTDCSGIQGGYCEETTSSAALSARRWNHVVVTYNDTANSIIFYIDGAPVADDGAASADSMLTDDLDFHIGSCCELGSTFFDGALDDVRLYNRALSPTEVQRLYKLGTVRITQ